MRTKNISWILALSAAFAVGCKQDGAGSSVTPSGTSELPSTNSSEKEKNNSCTIATVTGGAEITCGETKAFIANGNNATAPKFPVLIDGSSNGMVNPSTPEVQVGDYLLSVAKDGASELITIWIEKEKAILQYKDRAVYPKDGAVFYESLDCSGEGLYQMSTVNGTYWWDNVREVAYDRIVYWDRYYRVNNKGGWIYPKSKKESNGSCTTNVNTASIVQGLYVTPADPGVTTVLLPGHRIKMK